VDPRVTDRQFQIIEILRRQLRPVSILKVAERLQVSERTVQRDVGGLRKLGVAITTEPGRRGGLLLTDQFPRAPGSKGLDSRFPTPSTANLNTALPGHHFIGRGIENAQLDQALESALSGRRRIAMVVGEPGIGKIRMIREFAACAESQGALAVWGGCRDIEGTPPY
jgi:biotin operon repressor